MADTKYTVGYGSQIFYAPVTGTTIGSYVKIAQSRDITTPESSVGDINLTNNDSPDNTKEYGPGMIDPDTIDFEVIYVQAQWLTLAGLYGDGKIYAWKEVLSDGMVVTFKGWIQKMNIETKTEDDADIGKLTIRTTGKTTYAAGTVTP